MNFVAMAKFKLTLEYEGTRYSGWQIQKEQRTIQGECFKACEELFKTKRFEFYGAGRTDAGVHALSQVAHLAVDTQLSPFAIRKGLNDLLPYDINILQADAAGARFHARHDAIARAYLYQISRRRTAFGKRYVWWIKDRLDLGNMQAAAQLFEGFQNYQSFTDDDPDEKSTQVEVRQVSVSESGDLITIYVVGSHFLWKMVRRMVGILVEVGRGNLKAEAIESLLSDPSRMPAQFTAPPSGLFLYKIFYQGQAIDTKAESILRL